jgi:hypothetical protein
MAMGADKGIRIDTTLRTDQDLQPLTVAKALKAIIEVSLITFHRSSSFISCLSFFLSFVRVFVSHFFA